MAGLSRRSRAALAAVAALAVGAGAWALWGPQPSPPRDLSRLESSGRRTDAATEEIIDNLRAIAAHLRRGEGLARTSGEIRSLTDRQRRSLQELAALLRAQVHYLERSRRSVGSARRMTSGLVRLSARRARALRAAVAALEELEAFARRAGRVSRSVARRARYGARLAEDSQRRFSGP